MEQVTAVLIDTVSIQKYVFASNRLKDNLGASQLVADIYEKELGETLEEVVGSAVDLNRWRLEPERIQLMEDSQALWETGYIGGGNALLFFRKPDHAREFVRRWSRRLLIHAPGLITAVAIDESFQLQEFEAELTKLFEQLVQNKNRFFPNTHLPKHGITADCSMTGLSTDVYYRDSNSGEYISSASMAKLTAAQRSIATLKRDYQNLLGDEFDFTDQLDKLGQKRGESHIAVVHIDGNGMGKRFMACRDLASLRKLSLSVDQATEKAFRQLLDYLQRRMAELEESARFSFHTEQNRRVLPLRPIVINGDDVTFITEGRLGVHLAEKFIEYWISQPAADGLPLSACAGVAITKTKYPFFRGYQTAEALCSNAKKKACQEEAQRCWEYTSWLDFHVTYGGFSGDLGEVREKHFRVKEGSLTFGPYLLNRGKEEEEYHIDNLKNGLRDFLNPEHWPRSKVKELRFVLPLGKEATERWIREQGARGLAMPKLAGSVNYGIKGWENNRTPYFDMIELLEFYPGELL